MEECRIILDCLYRKVISVCVCIGEFCMYGVEPDILFWITGNDKRKFIVDEVVLYS